MKEKINQNNIDTEFKDIIQDNKKKTYVIVVVLYIVVIILFVILIMGLKGQKNTINNSLNTQNNKPIDGIRNIDENSNAQDNIEKEESEDILNENYNLDNDNTLQLEDDSSILDYIG